MSDMVRAILQNGKTIADLGGGSRCKVILIDVLGRIVSHPMREVHDLLPDHGNNGKR